MFAAGCLSQIASGPNNERDNDDNKVDGAEVDTRAVHGDWQRDRWTGVLRYSRGVKKKRRLTKESDTDGRNEPTPRTPQNSPPAFMSPADGEAK